MGLAALVCCLIAFIPLDDAPTKVVLGGPRQVVATVASEPESYLVTVRMLAVCSFDEATNQSLNRQKASLMASRALLSFIQRREPSSSGTLTVSRTSTVSSALKADLFEQTIRFPRSAVSVGPAKDNPPHATGDQVAETLRRKASLEGDLFSRKQDYFDTLVVLGESIDEELRTLRAAEPTLEPAPEFDSRIAGFEESQVMSLTRLRREVAEDRLLLSIERQEIVARIDRQEEQLLQALTRLVESHEARINHSSKPEKP